MTEVRIREILKSEAMRHRALARLMHEPQLRQDHLAVAEALEEILEEQHETKAIYENHDGAGPDPQSGQPGSGAPAC